ncbi:MAG TPA: hypothetical protein ENJ45_01050, partial [Phaeodactylibacter sp.]|nr:hypothetical protein [Phaeodactylibacter sp.]
MKHILSFLLATVLAISTFAFPQTSNGDYTYTIHIGAFIKAIPSDFDEIRPYGFLYAQKRDKLLQVYMGDYPTEAQAMKVLELVQAHNYPDAFVTRRDLSKGKNVRMIQLAAKPLSESIDWQHFATAGKLYVLLEGKTVKILTGTFDNVAAAKEYLSRVKKAGFKDAFAKRVNDVLLHPVTEFEAGSPLQYRSLPSTAIAETVTKKEAKEEKTKSSQHLFVRPPKVQDNTIPHEKEILTPRGEETAPKSYDLVGKRLKPKSETKAKSKNIIKPTPTPTKIKTPAIRANVKRNSAYNLQVIMKKEGTYHKSLDGYYGAGTQKAWNKIKHTNAQLKKYILLSKMEDKLTERSTANILQHYVQQLPYEPAKAIKGLKTSEQALAKAYLAYGLFMQKGPHKEVNDLMNAAIKETFGKKKLENKPPFDYTAAYDYKDINQLILHLRHIQGAAKEPIEVPAWLFTQHPKEALSAFEPYAEFVDDNNYPVQNALSLFDWEEFSLLQTILNDLDTRPASAKKENDNNYLRSRLLLAPKPLSEEDLKSITQWNKNLWKK